MFSKKQVFNQTCLHNNARLSSFIIRDHLSFPSLLSANTFKRGANFCCCYPCQQLRNLTKLSELKLKYSLRLATARIQLLEDAQRPSSTTSIESSLSALTAIQTDQQAILKDVLIQSNTQHATLSALTSMILSQASPHPPADPLKPFSTTDSQ